MRRRKTQTLLVLFLSLLFIFGVSLSGTEASALKLPDDIPDQPFLANGWRSLDQDEEGNSNIDLSTFSRSMVNSPAKLTGGAFDRGARDYYMFFGHVGSGNRYSYTDGVFNKEGNMLAPLGRATELPLLGPAMIGVKKDPHDPKILTQILFGYDYSYGTYNKVGETASRFDIGDVEQNLITGTWGVTRAGKINTVTDVGNLNDTFIMEQYVKDNEIVAYGYYGRGLGKAGTSIEYLPVRVHGYVVDFETGRIRYDVSYYNNSGQTKNYAMTHASHMDVGGNHRDSKLYSYGDDGIYFDEPTKTLADGIPARIYFYTNSGYNQSKGPNKIKIGNLGTKAFKIGNWFLIDGGDWKLPADTGSNLTTTSKLTGATDAYQAWDTPMPKDTLYRLTHPIFALRWDINSVAPNRVGIGSLDMSIEEPADLKPGAKKSFENLTVSTPKKNVVGDTLEFTLTATNHGAGVISDWKQITLVDILPKELELVRDSLSVTDTDGTVTNLALTDYQFVQGIDTNSFKLNKLYTIAPDKQVTVKYKAKIISGVNTTITNSFFAYNPEAQNDSSEVNIPISEEPVKPEALKTFTNDTTPGNEHRIEDTLSFELTATNSGGSTWKGVTWKDTYPKELEVDKTSFELVDTDGIATATIPTFTENPHTFEIKGMDALDVEPGKQIKVRYKAKIISGENTTIINKFEATNSLNQKAEAQASIDVLPKKLIEKDLIVEFVNKAGDPIHDPVHLPAKVGDFVKLKDIAETTDSDVYKAIQTVEGNGYELIERPINELSVEIIDGVNRVTYIFDGKLLLFSAPKTIDFRVQKYDGKTNRVNDPDYSEDLVIKDGRLAKERWTLTAKLTTEMSNVDPSAKNIILKNALRYVSGGKEIILNKSAQSIAVATNKIDQELYNVSDSWSGTQTGDGFKLEVDPGDVKKLGSYEAEILWELSKTPE